MRQLLQDVSTGEVTLVEVPAPVRGPASLLVASRFSVVSAGTERAALELGRASLVGKARARPDLAKKVMASAKEEGLAATYAKIRGRLEQPNALGYSVSGVVLEACDGAPAGPGELVACAGAGYASHAEIVAVPRTLCARVPGGVTPEDAAFATIAAIALHGVRLTQARLGDLVAVVGLGLVGQLTLELLRAAGCVVLGTDPNHARVELAQEVGFFATTSAADLEDECARLTSRRGADAVMVTAASKDRAPLESAIALARERATVCVVGDVPIEASRAQLFAKELRLVVSRSYGPGRYDPIYEAGGVDYPPGYVRWTEGRNLEEVLRLMATRALNPSRLATHTFDIDEGPGAYALLGSDKPSLGILLRYPENTVVGPRRVQVPRGRRNSTVRRLRRARPRVGIVGAGLFARTVLLPALAPHVDLIAVATSTGVTARAAARRFGAARATTDPDEVLTADDVDAVVIATRHDTHAPFATKALRAGKHVFVEKPLSLDDDGLRAVEEAASVGSGILFVGFNRRFAPLALRLRDALGRRGPLLMSYRVNAGRLPRSHWTHDPEVGGGRIVGEVCHFVDFTTFLTGVPPDGLSAMAVSGGSEPPEDSLCATLRYPGGSVAQILYTAYGDQALPKERLEVFGEVGAGVLDDFRELRLYRHGEQKAVTSSRDKGHSAELQAFLRACRQGVQPWPIEEMASVMRATFDIRDALRQQAPPPPASQ